MDTKISFGFKSVAKKAPIILNNLNSKPEQQKVELIECFDQQSIKIKGQVQQKSEPLVIPMVGKDKTLLDRVKEANDLKERSYKRFEWKAKEVEDTRADSDLTAEELAARKLLQEAKNADSDNSKTPAAKILQIPAIEEHLILEGAQEPTNEDYEKVPISDFGLAMLRGMGWSEKDAHGNKKVDAPELRAKGMGLGADKMIKKELANKPCTDKNGKELALVKGARAKIIAGKEKGNYCTVEGFDEDSCRVIVKCALNGAILSLNEFLLIPVTQEEFAKSSKVLNNSKYEEYLEKRTEAPKVERPRTNQEESHKKREIKREESRCDNSKRRSRSREKYSSRSRHVSSSRSRSRSRSRERNVEKTRKEKHYSESSESSDAESRRKYKKSSRHSKKAKKSSKKSKKVKKSRKRSSSRTSSSFSSSPDRGRRH